MRRRTFTWKDKDTEVSHGCKHRTLYVFYTPLLTKDISFCCVFWYAVHCEWTRCDQHFISNQPTRRDVNVAAGCLCRAHHRCRLATVRCLLDGGGVFSLTCSSLVYSWKHSSKVQLCCCRCCCCWFLTLSASFTTSSWMLPNRLNTKTHNWCALFPFTIVYKGLDKWVSAIKKTRTESVCIQQMVKWHLW